MNLSLGEIELNDITFSKDTSIDKVLASSKFKSYPNSSGTVYIFISKQVLVDEYTFNVEIYYRNNKIEKILLTPVNLAMADPGYSDIKYQLEKKKVADSFVQSNLGCPQKRNKSTLCYEYDWGSIISKAYLKGRNMYSGGFICIKYKRT